MSGPGHRYHFGPLERRGLIAGWRGGQIAAVAAGVVVAVGALGARPGPGAAVAAVAALGAGVGLAWWPLAGRTAEEWVPTVVRWGLSGTSRRRSGRADAPATGQCMGADGRPCRIGTVGTVGTVGGHAVRRVRPAGVFAGLEVLDFEAGGDGPLGVVHDRTARTYTASMTVQGHSFALLGSDEKERRVASWGAVLAAMARERSVVHRLQWAAATVPDDGAAVHSHFLAHATVAPDAPCRRSYEETLGFAGAQTCRHDVTVSLQIRSAGPAARAIRGAGGGDRGACAVLSRELVALRRQLATADVPVDRVLDARALAAVVRRAAEARPSRPGPCPPCGIGWPWPVATTATWASLRTDETWHATYWVAEWPRVAVGPEFLGPLLLGPVRRSVAVVMEPLGPARAVRQVERARTADVADAELRRRGGFLSTARRAKEADLVAHREEEIAEGHASFRFSGYVTVTATTQEDLAAGCEATEQAAGLCRLELRRLYGDQERAFACTLPLARGLS